MSVVLWEQNNEVGVITINNQRALNALSLEIFQALEPILDEQHSRFDTKVIIIKGAGEKAFVAGADISYLQKATPQEAVEFSKTGHRIFAKIQNLNKITIAAVNGFALGGGCELALSCDIRIGADAAKLGIPETKLGLFPGFGGCVRLPRLIGSSRAIELMATGRQVNAEEAKAWGLLNHVVPKENLMAFCLEMAEAICANSASAINMGKHCMYAGLEMDFERALDLEAAKFGLLFSMPDFKEGITAFFEKRKPNFQ